MYTLRYQSSGDSQVRRVCPLVVTEALLTRPLWPWLVLLRELMQIPESGPTQSLWLHTKNPVSLYPRYSTVATLQEVTTEEKQGGLPKSVSLCLNLFSPKASPPQVLHYSKSDC